MKTIKLFYVLVIFSILFTSCSSDDDKPFIPISLGEYNGIIISAEGNFQDKDGSVSFVDYNLSGLATNFIYTGVNDAQLGGLIQSIAFNENDAYIILNDVNTIVVVDRYTFEKKSTIETGLKKPRYMAFANGKGYVTNWGAGEDREDDYLAVIDLATNSIEEDAEISLDNGVEQIVSINNKLYVTHKGAYSSNNIVSVVDLNNNNSVSEITVNDNPDEIIVDNSGNLILLCEGKPTYGGAPDYAIIENTTSAITFIDTTSDEVIKEIEFAENERATLLAYENGKVYYYKSADSKVYTIDATDTSLASEGLDVENLYGMSVKDNKLYTVKYAFTNLSNLSVYDVTSQEKIYSSAVGLGASKIYFN